jgi:hypothetical protein
VLVSLLWSPTAICIPPVIGSHGHGSIAHCGGFLAGLLAVWLFLGFGCPLLTTSHTQLPAIACMLVLATSCRVLGRPFCVPKSLTCGHACGVVASICSHWPCTRATLPGTSSCGHLDFAVRHIARPVAPATVALCPGMPLPCPCRPPSLLTASAEPGLGSNRSLSGRRRYECAHPLSRYLLLPRCRATRWWPHPSLGSRVHACAWRPRACPVACVGAV